MIYFWADTHFNHGSCIEFCNRPYANVDVMNADLIQRWNDTVRDNDTIYHVGDFAFRTADGPRVVVQFEKLFVQTAIFDLRDGHDRNRKFNSTPSVFPAGLS